MNQFMYYINNCPDTYFPVHLWNLMEIRQICANPLQMLKRMYFILEFSNMIETLRQFTWQLHGAWI